MSHTNWQITLALSNWVAYLTMRNGDERWNILRRVEYGGWNISLTYHWQTYTSGIIWNNCHWTASPWNLLVFNMHSVEFGFKMNWCRFHQLITWLIFVVANASCLGVECRVPLVEKQFRCCHFGRIPLKADCQLITTWVLNAIFFLFSRVIGESCHEICRNHVLQHIILLSTQVNFLC